MILKFGQATQIILASLRTKGVTPLVSTDVAVWKELLWDNTDFDIRLFELEDGMLALNQLMMTFHWDYDQFFTVG